MPIEPDTKDWTWVLERPCDECGMDVTALEPRAVADLVRANAAEWRRLLDGADAERLRRRPREDRWSALEYAGHVRDVFVLYDQRLHLMLDEDDPRYPNWDQDRAAVEGRYGEQDPAAVLAAIEAAADRLAASFDAVPDGAWGRTGTRSDGARFTVGSFARYLIHDPVHHVHDVEVGERMLTP